MPLKPKNLIVSTGANCLRATNISAEDVIADLTAIDRLCLENEIRPIFLTLMPINPANIQNAFHTPTDPNWHAKLDKINAYIRHQQYHIDLEPYFYDASGQLDEKLSIDGIHPDLRGKMLMAEIINKHRKLFKSN